MEDQAVILLLCFGLVWLWRRRQQRRNTAIGRAMASRRRREAFRRRQEDELNQIMMIMARRHVLLAVRQRRTVWVRHRSQAFLNNVVATWEDEEWKRNFRIGDLHFVFCAPNSIPTSSEDMW